MGIGQQPTMPLFFASNAIYPISIMPVWLQAVSTVSPLTYEVDALHSLMVIGEGTTYGVLVDLVVLLATTALLVMAAARLYPKLVV